jgi:hypothetical protein
MKNITLGLAFLIATATLQAQNKNVTKTTETTVTTIKDSEGVKKLVKEEATAEVQSIKLGEAKAGTKNIDIEASPTEVLKTTQITNADGTTRTVDVDMSGYYLGENGQKYRMDLDPQGYTLYIDKKGKPNLLRKTSINTFFYRNGSETAMSYFDQDGNLVVESYDYKTDIVTTKKYKKEN